MRIVLGLILVPKLHFRASCTPEDRHYKEYKFLLPSARICNRLPFLCGAEIEVTKLDGVVVDKASDPIGSTRTTTGEEKKDGGHRTPPLQ